jgi:hypothetical protein
MRFKLGYRKQAPDVVGPLEAHRYSQPSRGTTNKTLEPHRARREHLEIRFPRVKRNREAMDEGIEENEVEEEYPSKDRIEKNKQYEKRGMMEPIGWRLDPEAMKHRKAAIETKRGYHSAENAQNTRDLIPDGHVTHHAATERSFDWPTSFDGDWGNSITLTINKKEYIYEDDSDIKRLSANDLQRRRDKDGRIRKAETKPRYKKIPSGPPVEVDVFEIAKNPNGTVIGRNRLGDWIGSMVKKTVQPMQYDLVRGRQRVTLEPRFQFTRRFQVRMKAMPKLNGTRPLDHQTSGKMDELSDEEDRAAGNPGSSEDEESDDEGDLFRLSYKECSGTAECSTTKRARKLRARMITEFGDIPSLTVASFVVWHNLSESEIRAEYKVLWGTMNEEV